MAKPLRRDSSSSGDSDKGESKVIFTKRRRTDNAFTPTFKQDLSSDHTSDDSSDDDHDDDPSSSKPIAQKKSDDYPLPSTELQTDHADVHESRKSRKPALNPLTKEELEASNAARARSGVIYLSKVPPFMKPQKVKHLLSSYGETNRIFLAPEDPKSYAKRVRFGGNKRKMFTEGWIEFTDKRKAKLVAETLNTQKIGGKKSSFYHDDLWNLKYLPKFKWDDLTAQIAAENASRQVRLASEIEQGKKEARHYLKNAERAKMISKIQATRAAKESGTNVGAAGGGGGSGSGGGGMRKGGKEESEMRRTFSQRDVKDSTKARISETSNADEKKMKAVMSNIFG